MIDDLFDEETTPHIKIGIDAEYGEHFKTREALTEFVEMISELVRDTVYITCIVYLRTKCHTCMMLQCADDVFDWVNNTGKNIVIKDRDLSQFWRQLVIFTKEWTEAKMTEPCTMEDQNTTVH